MNTLFTNLIFQGSFLEFKARLGNLFVLIQDSLVLVKKNLMPCFFFSTFVALKITLKKK